MKKRLTSALAVGVLAASMLPGAVSAGGDKVSLCHFGGHHDIVGSVGTVQNVGPVGDMVAETPVEQTACMLLGGQVILVSEKALGGHRTTLSTTVVSAAHSAIMSMARNVRG